MPAGVEAARSLPDLCMKIGHHGIHFLTAAALVHILSIPISQYRHLLSWHAILGAIAFLWLMSESILIFSQNPWYKAILRRHKVLIHGLLLGTATVLAILATCFEYHRKATRRGHAHFDSFHGVSALLATMCAILACGCGVAVAYCQWLQSHVLNINATVLKLSHNIIGQLAYALGIFSLCCAYYSNWAISRTSPVERVLLLFVTGFIALWTLFHALKSGCSQIQALKVTSNSCEMQPA